MNKNKNIIIAVVILVLLAAGGFLFLNKSGTNPLSNTSGNIQKGSLKGLLGMGSNQQCAYTDVESGSTGTFYVSSGKARGDFTTTVEERATQSHMIIDDKGMYVWSEGEAQGLMMNRKAIDNVEENTSKKAPQAVDVNKELDYQCSSWSVDSSAFTPPSDVTFQDFSTMMQDATKSTGGTLPDSSAACAACNNLPADAQAQCKSALSCN